MELENLVVPTLRARGRVGAQRTHVASRQDALKPRRRSGAAGPGAAAGCRCGQPLTVVADALPLLVGAVPLRRHAVAGAVGAEDPAAYAAVVAPHDQPKGRLALVAGLALAVVHPQFSGLLGTERPKHLAEERLHALTTSPSCPLPAP